MEEKQQRVSKYENMHISAALLPTNSDRLESGGDVSSESSEGPRMMCVARRIPHSEKPMPTIKQFTIKLDPTGRITSLDGSGLSPAYAKYIGKVRRHATDTFTYFNMIFINIFNLRRRTSSV